MKTLIHLVGALLLTLVITGAVIFPYITQDTVTVTVTDKENVKTSSNSKYLIFSDEETFENEDCWRLWKFNSSDVYGKIKVNQRYTFKVYGWRIPVFSQYRNIFKVTLVPTEDK